MRSARPALLAAAVAAVALAGCDSARPVEQSEASACARCHGFPPPPGLTDPNLTHPQGQACEVCHPQTVLSGTELVPGGAHMNGRVDVGTHPVPYPTHLIDALQGLQACAWCHGSDLNGGVTGRSCNACHGDLGFADWRTNCTFCHGTRTAGWTAAQLARAAPPAALPQLVDGHIVHEFDPAYRGVGAHQAHVNTGTFAGPVACSECHVVPANLEQPTHLNQQVDVAFGAIASNGTAPTWTGTTCANYCHGATMPHPETRTAPTWAPPSTIACGDCHEANPTTGKHPAVVAQHGFECRTCHGGTYTPTAVDKTLHVNGTVDKNQPLIGWDPANRTCLALCHSTAPRSW
jgi:hypothetical protein